ncbi:MAG: potassium transporter TrkA [Actinomycetota bacterium]|nr:potassium transporter TrkA [Actinomycetota bacterium]
MDRARQRQIPPGLRLSPRARLRYRFDNLVASGTRPLIVGLAVATVALILVAATVQAILRINVDGLQVGFLEALWLSLLRTLDPGTMADDVGWPFRVISLIVTLGGVLIVSSLIGLLANGINQRVMELGRGRTLVAETGHTLILGWSPAVFTILSELVLANRNLRRASVVVLAPFDKSEMDQELKTRIRDRGPTDIVVRTGSPYEAADLSIVNPTAAKSIVVVRPDNEDGDAFVVKTVLALISSNLLRPGASCVAEMRDQSMAESLRQVVPDSVDVVQSQGIMARITAQVCRQPGLGKAYQDLLDFGGDEIYFRREPSLRGMTFGDALLCFDDSSVIGLRRRDGTVVLNPPMETVIAQEDEIIAVAEDDDRIRFTGRASFEPQVTADSAHSSEREPEHFLILGWNELAPRIIRELDHYVSSGSEVVVVPNGSAPADNGVSGGLRNIKVEWRSASIDADTLDGDLAGDRPLDHVLLLSDRRRGSEATADARALMTLLQIRQWIHRSGHDINVVLELLDERDVALVPPSPAEEFIVSEQFTSLLMAQLSENAEVGHVFADLLDEAGSELYLKPANLYAPPQEVAYGNVVAAARARGEVALGYRSGSAGDGHRGVVLNPPKSSRIRLASHDSVLVLAETH